MTCKKSELISAINSFGAARASDDLNLVQLAAQYISQLINTLEFEPEEEEIVSEEDNEDQPE